MASHREADVVKGAMRGLGYGVPREQRAAHAKAQRDYISEAERIQREQREATRERMGR